MKKLFFICLIALYFIPETSAQCDSLLSDSAIDQIACEGEDIRLRLGVYVHRKGGTWSSPELSTTNPTPVLRSFSYSQYLTYTYTDNTNSCTASDSIYVKVNPSPKVNLTRPADICSNESCFPLGFQASPLGGSWSVDKLFGGSLSSGTFCPSKVDVSSGTPISLFLFYAYTDGNGCSSKDSTVIVVRPAPNLKLKDSMQMAIKDSILILDNQINSEGRGKTQWSGPGVILDTDNQWKFSAKEVGQTKGFYELIYTYKRISGAPPFCTSQDTLVVELVDQLVSTQSVSQAEQLQVYPNPSHGVVQLQHSNAFQYRVFDIHGKLIESSASFLNRSELQLEEGVYWLSVRYQDGQLQTQTIVIH